MWNGVYTQVLTEAFFVIAKNWKQSNKIFCNYKTNEEVFYVLLYNYLQNILIWKKMSNSLYNMLPAIYIKRAENNICT